jgi:hypothetical protein
VLENRINRQIELARRKINLNDRAADLKLSRFGHFSAIGLTRKHTTAPRRQKQQKRNKNPHARHPRHPDSQNNRAST